jgi:HAMP domain-containing protein
MEAILDSQVFFFISSMGFIILGAMTAVFLFYLIRATRAFSQIMDKVEEDVEHIGDTTKEMLDEVKDSMVFNFLFRKKKKERKNK